MTTVNPVPIVDDLETLEAFLSSDRAPPGAMPISVLDGYLTAIAVGPELVMPGVWLPEVWGGGSPEFADVEEANRVLGAMMGHYNAIIRGLDADPPGCAPIFEEDDDGRVFADRWAEGFVVGMSLGVAAWNDIFDDEDAYACMVPILGLCADDEGRSRLELDAKFAAELAAAAPVAIPICVLAIRAFWRSADSGHPAARAGARQNAERG